MNVIVQVQQRETLQEMQDWCYATFLHWTWHGGFPVYTFKFSEESDAVMFVIRFGGYVNDSYTN
jgi:hypothetical protein